MHQLLSKRQAAERVGYHPEHLMRLARANLFPHPIRLGNGKNCAVRFVEDEVDAWMGEKIAERDRSAGA